MNDDKWQNIINSENNLCNGPFAKKKHHEFQINSRQNSYQNKIIKLTHPCSNNNVESLSCLNI